MNKNMEELVHSIMKHLPICLIPILNLKKSCVSNLQFLSLTIYYRSMLIEKQDSTDHLDLWGEISHL